MTDKIINHFGHFENDLGDYAENEVLYGIAGYLYCLLMILTEYDKNHKEAIQISKLIIDTIINDGMRWSKN